MKMLAPWIFTAPTAQKSYDWFAAIIEETQNKNLSISIIIYKII